MWTGSHRQEINFCWRWCFVRMTSWSLLRSTFLILYILNPYCITHGQPMAMGMGGCDWYVTGFSIVLSMSKHITVQIHIQLVFHFCCTVHNYSCVEQASQHLLKINVLFMLISLMKPIWFWISDLISQSLKKYYVVFRSGNVKVILWL